MFSFLSNKFEQVFDFLKGIETISEDNIKKILEIVENTLIEADTPISVINYFLESLKEKCIGTKLSKTIKPQEFISKQLYDILIEFFGGQNKSKKDFLKSEFFTRKKDPFVILLMGLQGAGKTTTISKILKRIISGNNSFAKKEDILTASLDYTRPASRKQLEILTKQNEVDYFDTSNIENIFNGAKEVLKEAKNLKKKIIIVDSAGRISLDKLMMNELKEISLILNPDIKFLVIDSMSGQIGLKIAKSFKEKVGSDSVILTKADSDAPCGIALGIFKELKIEISYLTTGEKPENFEIFNPVKIVRRILGEGDLLSLVEIANEKISKSEEKIIKNVTKNKDISIDEYIKIINMIEKMGPMKDLIAQIPREIRGNQTIDNNRIDEFQDNSKKFKFMCDSMNKKEKKAPELIYSNFSRKKRIAKGSGLSEKKIDDLLNQYKSMKEQLKHVSKYLKHFI